MGWEKNVSSPPTIYYQQNKMKLGLHQWQAISLLIAGILLWVPIPGFEHTFNMAITTVIIAVNAFLEFRGQDK